MICLSRSSDADQRERQLQRVIRDAQRSGDAALRSAPTHPRCPDGIGAILQACGSPGPDR
jgi:hypothetical protein